MEKQAKKRSLYISPKLFERVEQLKKNLEEGNEREVSLTETLEAILKNSFKKQEKVMLVRTWSFDQVTYRLKRANPTLFRALLTKENLKALIAILEAKAKETEAALEGEEGSIHEPRLPRKRKSNRAAADIGSTSSTVAEGVGNDKASDAASATSIQVKN